MYHENRTHRRLRWALAYVFGVLALAVVGLVIEAAVSPGPKSPQSLPPTSLPTPPWVTSAPLPAASTHPALTGPVQLVQGRQLINGVYLGFPQSTAGAVSAADAVVTEVGSTLDPDRAAAVMRMTADPSFTGAPEQAAEGALNDRKDLGLPSDEPVPDGASVQIVPVDYQVRGVSADLVTVLLLCDFVSSVPGQGTQTQIGVFPVRMHWVQDDWKVLAVGGDSYSSLVADPGSPQAASLGWQVLVPTGS